MRRQFFQPNSKAALLASWKQESLLMALGVLLLNGGRMAGVQLGAAIGQSPRGLRRVFLGQNVICPQIQDGDTWYFINSASLPLALPAPEREKP